MTSISESPMYPFLLPSTFLPTEETFIQIVRIIPYVPLNILCMFPYI